MNSFMKGLLVGVGVGLLVAPMRGEEMRRLLQERFSELRANLPENEQLSQYAQQISRRVSQTSSDLRDYATQAVGKVASTGNDLGDIAQQASTTVKQAGQDVAQTTKKAAKSAAQSTETGTSTPPPTSYSS
jgi:gas vesicle protein